LLIIMSRKVLFVDDEVEMCFMVANLLKHHGYEVVTAETAESALELGFSLPLDLIILDINLAGENGLQLMSYLKRNSPDVPIIIYTGMELEDQAIQKALADGAHQYIRKGGPLHEFVQAVQSVVP
jgi:CheY-like chemotaxis protein